MNKKIMLVALFVCVLLLTRIVMAYGLPAVDWHVIGGGGGSVEAGGHALGGTIGQAVVGTVADDGLTLCSGFWCGAGVTYHIHLPVVLRNA